ncbi:hypothetical protein Agub_g11180 [Astrephomene gubernaculifera]|uniref:Protein kinase domain-containing protein n=1 Tax=Astrephomene gubernaculifera TaxID=47775 RepID=A0AAD3HQR1_9CHLO|nr:hypothetical protein Agub_g11180 [Astrephomene gubernaculifera]
MEERKSQQRVLEEDVWTGRTCLQAAFSNKYVGPRYPEARNILVSPNTRSPAVLAKPLQVSPLVQSQLVAQKAACSCKASVVSEGFSTQSNSACVTSESAAVRDSPAGTLDVVAGLRLEDQRRAHIRQDVTEPNRGSAGRQGLHGIAIFAQNQACGTACQPQKDAPAPSTATVDQTADNGLVTVPIACCCGTVDVKPDDINVAEEALAVALSGMPHDIPKYGAPRPANEDTRMATVRALRNMQINECPELNLVLQVVCRIWSASSACITMLDSDQVFICSAEGGMVPARRPWSIAMCPWMLLSRHPTAMAVGDLTADARFARSAHVEAGTRSYLTSPLVASNGHRLGAICLTDNKPRKFDAGDCRMMNNCAELAIRALEAHMGVCRRLGLCGEFGTAASRLHQHQLHPPAATAKSHLRSGPSPQSTCSAEGGASPPCSPPRPALDRLLPPPATAASPCAGDGGEDSSKAGSGGGNVGRAAAGQEEEQQRRRRGWRPRASSSSSSASLDTDDGALMEEYCNRVRDLTEADEAVVLLLDTRSPGWAILYVSPAWEAFTGISREQAMGATLNEVMAHVSGDPRVVWEGVEREAAAGKAFVTPRVYIKASPAVTFYLSFRPAALDDLDDNTVTLGVPASVPQAASATTSRLFFARLHCTPDPPAASRTLTAAPGSALLTTGRRLPPAIAINPVHGLTEIFAGLTVGQVLGQGSYGTVYHARWHGVDVAIKVQDMHIRSNGERMKAEFEVGLGERLHHLNVVHTLAHASALLERSGNSAILDTNDSNNWNAGLALTPQGFMLGTASNASGGAAAGGMPTSSLDASYDAGPAFIPFFAGGDAATAAAVAAAAAAAAGASGRSTPHNEFMPPMSYCRAAGSSAGGATGGMVRVALPSGAHVPMLLQQRTGGTGVGLLGSSTQSRMAAPSLLPPLAALLAARGSSASLHSGYAAGSTPNLAATPTALSMTNQRMLFTPTRTASGSAGAAAAAAPGSSRQPSQGVVAGQSSSVANPPATASSNAEVRAAHVGEGNDCGGGNKGNYGFALSPFCTTVDPGHQEEDMRTSAGHADVRRTCAAVHARAVGSAHVAVSSGQHLSTVPARGVISDVLNCGGVGGARSSGASGIAGGVSALEGGFGSSVHLATVLSCGASAVHSQAASSLAGGTASGITAADPAGVLQRDEGVTGEAAAADAEVEVGAVQLDVLLEGEEAASPADANEAIESTAAVTTETAAAFAGGAGGGGAFAVMKVPAPAPGSSMEGLQGPIEADLSGVSYPLDVRLWMLLEFMDKGNLQDAIDRGWLREGRAADNGPDYCAVLATAGEVAGALAYLHAHDVVHGDLSAVNVLLQSVRSHADGVRREDEAVDTAGRGFIAKISDFGLSMQLTSSDQAIKTGSYGTITHMAPEVLRESALSKPGDVYSVGVLLWQMVTCSRPWAGLSHLQVSVEVGQKQRCLQWPGWVHGGVRALGQRCMSPRPRERPTAAQLQAELAGLMRQVPQYG